MQVLVARYLYVPNIDKVLATTAIEEAFQLLLGHLILKRVH